MLSVRRIGAASLPCRAEPLPSRSHGATLPLWFQFAVQRSLRVGKVRILLEQALEVEISTGSINAIRCRLSESLATLVEEATDAIRQEKVAHLDETGVPIGNTDGNNPEKKRGWLWVMVTPALTMFHLALRRSGEMARQVLGEAFAGVVVTDR